MILDIIQSVDERLRARLGLDIPEVEAALIAFCERHDIRKLAVFGSVLRDDFREDGDDPSDVDVLVEFKQGVNASLFDLGRVQMELTGLLKQEADVKTSGFLSRYFRNDVVRNALPIYQR